MGLYDVDGIINSNGVRYEWRGDFLGFSLDGVHSSTLGLTRISDGDRYEDILLPSFSDVTTNASGVDGTYYFGSNFTQKTFSIKVSYDGITDTQLRKIRQLCSKKEPVDLIFDEFPYKVYTVKISDPPQFSYLCFDEGVERVYKGEGTFNFISYAPFARSRFQYIEDYNLKEISEWAGVGSNKMEWLSSSGIRSKKEKYNLIHKLIPEINIAPKEQEQGYNDEENLDDDDYGKKFIKGAFLNSVPNVGSFSINYEGASNNTADAISYENSNINNGTLYFTKVLKFGDARNWENNLIVPIINPGDREAPFSLTLFYDSIARESEDTDKISKREFKLYLNYAKKEINEEDGVTYYVPDKERQCGYLDVQLDWRCRTKIDMVNHLITTDYLEIIKTQNENGNEQYENRIIKDKEKIIYNDHIKEGDFFNIPTTQEGELLILRLDIENNMGPHEGSENTNNNNNVSYQKGYIEEIDYPYYIYY